MKPSTMTTGRLHPKAQRRVYLQRKALDAFTRASLIMSPLALLLCLCVDLSRGPGPIWTHAPAAMLCCVQVLGFWRSVHYQRKAMHAPFEIARDYQRSIVVCVAMGGLWVATILMTSVGTVWLMQGLLVPTLIYGSILMAPVRTGALLYILIVIVTDILFMPKQAAGDHTFELLVAIYGVIGIALTVWQHAEFARSACNEMKLEEQAEIIGILLREFEEQGSDWLWETDANLRIGAPSQRLLAVLGCSRQTLARLALRAWIGGRLRHAAAGEEGFRMLADSLDARLPFRDVCIPVGNRHRQRWLLLTGKPVLNQDGSFRGYRGVGSDITATRQGEEQISWLAHHDSLTRLPNRGHFHVMLEQACTRQRAVGQPLALLCLDLDGFKAINDTIGHLAGDALLTKVADRLRRCIREHDVVGRLGGDEFALLLPGCDRDSAGHLAERILERISEPYMLDGSTVGISVSIGIGIMLSPDDAPVECVLSGKDLLKGADLAMYRAKRDGRATIRFFEASMRDDMQNRLQLQADLRHAIGRDELLLHFQPIMQSATGRIVAAEALVRWMHPTSGLIPPANFIPLAEESGLINRLGVWVLRQACREAAMWPEEISISVNLSPIQLRDPSLPAIVEAALFETGLRPDRLELEITESLFLEPHPLVRETLSRLRKRGIRIALDDFGTGFSSLSYLRSFPVDTVKIDRSFVRDLGCDRDADMIVQAITDMATGLGITITAEGVETADQEARLRASGCDQFQGYLYSRPCDAASFRRFMAIQDAACSESRPIEPRQSNAAARLRMPA